MKRWTAAITFVAGLGMLAGCGTFQPAGPLTSQHRNLTDVRAVVLQTSGDLTIRIGADEGLTVTAGTGVIDALTSEISDGTLVLGAEANRSINGQVSYSLTVRGLEDIEVQGSGSVTGAAVLTGHSRLSISGSGEVNLSELSVPDLSADLSGSGGAVLAGTSQASTVVVSGSGDFQGSALITTRTWVDSSGSGTVTVNVTDQLSVRSSGSGDVGYRGNPAAVDRDASGSGDIIAG
jgi:hypothetical protein